MRAHRSLMLVCAGLVAATLALPAQGDTVQGIATVGETNVALSHGMAVAYKAPNGQLVSVLLSDKPADAKAFAEDTKTGPGEPLVAGRFLGAWLDQHVDKKFSGVSFTIGPNGLMLDHFLIGGQDDLFGLGEYQYTLTLKSRAPRLVGTLKTKVPAVDLGNGRSAGLDAMFDLAVAQR
jgi:hypothetical protein